MKDKLYLKIGQEGVFDIFNLTGIGPEKLREAVISLNNRDMYISSKPEEVNSKYGYLYISGYSHPSIVNDFYKIIFDNKDYVSKIMKEYSEN